MSDIAPFRLSLQLEGHTADVRSVSALRSASPLSSVLLSGSRDGTARVWKRPIGSKDKKELICKYILEGQAGFVNSCAWLDSGHQAIALAGGQDHLVNAYPLPSADTNDVSSLTPEYTLVGHEGNVCALDVFPGRDEYIVTGSWDKTAKVWRKWECIATLSGHDQAVWAVLALDNDHVLTASADKLIRLYSISNAVKEGGHGSPIATFTGSNDAVRGLVRISEDRFAACGNDGNIYVYPIGGSLSPDSIAEISPLQTLSGHTSFVYSLAMLSSNEIASSGEDRSVRIWRDGQLSQTITIPAISVWSVTSLPNGDLACASSDGFVRLFTRTPQRFADPDILQAYETAVSSQALNSTQVGDVKKEDLPGADALGANGKEGQVKMIRNGDLVEAHQYSVASGRWEKIGEVVGGVGSSQKKLHDGKEYDYVFDVDIADGVPPLKLPYNASENPYVVAQRFLEKNELPLTYLDQVVSFIEKNTGAVNIGSSNFVDPYTGGSSYRPGASSAASEVSHHQNASPSVLPQKKSLTFTQFNAQGAGAKIEDISSHLSSPASLSEQELATLQAFLPKLAQLAENRIHSLDGQGLTMIVEILKRWPIAQRFPLMDAFRVVCLSEGLDHAQMIRYAFDAAAWDDAWPGSVDEAKTRITLSMLAFRASANALSKATEPAFSEACSLLAKAQHYGKLTKLARTAYVTVLLNISVQLASRSSSSPFAASLLKLVTQSLQHEAISSERDAESTYRAIVALGNILISSSSGSLPIADVQTSKAAAESCSRLFGEPRIKTLIQEINDKFATL